MKLKSDSECVDQRFESTRQLSIFALRPGIDSLNVAAATAVACYALQRR
jgi:tRNA G18 (ribose-2'-O)-methylase SpoU